MFASKDTLLTRPSGGYSIARSVRFRSSASAYFNRTFGTPTTQNIWTWSGWIKRGVLTGQQWFFGAGGTSNPREGFNFLSDNTLDFTNNTGGSPSFNITTTQVFRDPSAWYHIIIAFDSTQATASNRIKVYVNGTQVTAFNTASYPSLNANAQYINSSGTIHNIGALPNGTGPFDGYLTEINFIDGQALTPSSFGETDSITGVWKPKAYSGTYGTNGFELNFSDNSNNTAATIGKDYSGNGNNWTPNNISVTAGVTYDSMVDSPTVGSLSSNYAVMNPLDFKGSNAPTLANANLRVNGVSTAAWRASASTIAFSSQKIYCEITLNGAGLTSGGSRTFGIIGTSSNIGASGVGFASNTGWGIAATTLTNDGAWTNGSKTTLTGISTASGTVYQIAVDGTIGSGSNKIWFGQNGTWFNSGDPSSGTSSIFSNLPSDMQFIAAILTDSGYDLDVNFGQRPFSYTPPTGFVALNTYNLPASTITNGAAYMAASLWTGNGTARSISNAVGSTSFQPDLVWVKSRTQAIAHRLIDSVRGAGNTLASNLTNAEFSDPQGVTSFNSGGFGVGTDTSYNQSSDTYVGWQWKAGGTSASNTNGSITSTVSVGATQGFSVVTYTGTGANATVGHGLGVAPNMIIVKSRSTAGTDWPVYHSSLGATGIVALDSTIAFTVISTPWNNTAPTSSVFSVGTSGDTNLSARTYVAYCFAAVAGYSAFGSYTGNGSADGPFVYTGFRPRFVLLKRTDSTGNWNMFDSSRNGYNQTNPLLFANASDAEYTTAGAFEYDILSNGFKVRNTGTGVNANGATVVYACFAEVPFRSALAR
jgi:hypothetical protein